MYKLDEIHQKKLFHYSIDPLNIYIGQIVLKLWKILLGSQTFKVKSFLQFLTIFIVPETINTLCVKLHETGR